MSPKVPPLRITTVAGAVYCLLPVPMQRMPSRAPDDWLAFQGKHVPGTLLDAEAQDALQRYMRRHGTEALTTGSTTLTLAGGMLAHCRPGAVQ